jgi:magnesium-transporting ATPase (P-type)
LHAIIYSLIKYFQPNESEKKEQSCKNPLNRGASSDKGNNNSYYSDLGVATQQHLLLFSGKKQSNKRRSTRTKNKKKISSREQLIANGHTMIQALDVNTASSNSIEQCIARLRTDPVNGLSQTEATRRLNFNGFNEFEYREKESLFGKYLEQVAYI